MSEFLFPMPDEPKSKLDTPGSHRNDPATSREAAKKLRESGGHRSQKIATLEAVRRCPGATHGELGRFMGVDWFIPARRLSELEREGLVTKGEPRVCRVKGTKCVTWSAVAQDELKG
jgi:hypothetical protein